MAGEQTERYFVEFRGRVYAFLSAIGVRPADAEEITQEAFIRLHEQLLNGIEIENPRAWLFRAARNLYVTNVRSRRWRSTVAEADASHHLAAVPGTAPDPEAWAIERQRQDRLASAMRALTPLQLEYLHLRAEGLRFREIAEIYNVAVPTVQDVVRRAIEKLGKEMQ